jgi:hypothetical protein
MAYDPLLGGRNYDLPQLEQQQEMLKQKWAELQQTWQQTATTPQKSPVWDEIDGIVDNMTEAEKECLMRNQEYVDSSNAIQQILQREIMRAMKPVVESTKDGKAALESHLILLRKVQKEAKDEASQRESLMNEYIMNHSDKTWAEFIAMKKGVTTNKKK